MLEIRDGEDLWQWSQLEIRLNAFCWSTIPQKQFIIIIIIISLWAFIAKPSYWLPKISLRILSVNMNLPPSSTFIWEEELVQYYLNFIQLLSNLSKIIPSKNTADIILQMLMALVFFVASKGKKLTKIVKLKK